MALHTLASDMKEVTMFSVTVAQALSSTSTSNSSMTPSTTPRLSMNPLTATRSIRFVVALYTVRRTVSTSSFTALLLAALAASAELLEPMRWFPLPSERTWDLVSENERCTRGDSSASTWRARRAEEARRWVGNGMEITLRGVGSCRAPEVEVLTVNRESRDREPLPHPLPAFMS